MRKVLSGLLLFASTLSATVISGKITDLTVQVMASNRSVVFTLENCGNNIPTITGSAVIVPATKTVIPNAAGNLAGTIVGNDIISCGTSLGQTYYQVAIFAGTQQVWSQNCSITGAAWNITTAIPLSVDPTAFMDLGTGYQLGDLIYGSVGEIAPSGMRM